VAAMGVVKPKPKRGIFKMRYIVKYQKLPADLFPVDQITFTDFDQAIDFEKKENGRVVVVWIMDNKEMIHYGYFSDGAKFVEDYEPGLNRHEIHKSFEYMHNIYKRELKATRTQVEKGETYSLPF
jgi:hypothetical protein